MEYHEDCFNGYDVGVALVITVFLTISVGLLVSIIAEPTPTVQWLGNDRARVQEGGSYLTSDGGTFYKEIGQGKLEDASTSSRAMRNAYQEALQKRKEDKAKARLKDVPPPDRWSESMPSPKRRSTTRPVGRD